MMCWNVSQNLCKVPHPRAEDVARPLPIKGEVFRRFAPELPANYLLVDLRQLAGQRSNILDH